MTQNHQRPRRPGLRLTELGGEPQTVGGVQGKGLGVGRHGRDASVTPMTAENKASESASSGSGSSRLPIKMLNDRVLVELEGAEGERRSTGGILIPATAQVGKRLTWALVVAIGPNVRSMQLDDRVLYNPEDRYEVEVGGKDYIILRERDIHAVAAKRLDDSPTGLYL